MRSTPTLRSMKPRGPCCSRSRGVHNSFRDRADTLRVLFHRYQSRRVSKPRSAADAVAALIRGYELGIERLDQTLNEFNAREIRCRGESFDPRRMNAIESEESAAVPVDTQRTITRIDKMILEAAQRSSSFVQPRLRS